MDNMIGGPFLVE